MEERLVRVGSFRVVPDALTFDPALSSGAKVLYAVLLTFAASETGQCWPGLEGVQRRIVERAQAIGAPEGFTPPSAATLKRALAELERAGWIARHRRRNTSSLTFIAEYKNERPPWLAPTLDGSNMSQPNSSEMSRPKGSKVSQPNSSEMSRRTRTREREPENELADKVAKLVYERRPNNAHKYLAIRAVAAKLLAAGHPPGPVAAAMIEAVTVTVNACEVQLRQTSRTAARPKLVAPTTETGLVDD